MTDFAHGFVCFDSQKVAVCNLASINLSALVIEPPSASGMPPVSPGSFSSELPQGGADSGGDSNGAPAKATFDFKKLQHIAEVVTRNLNRVIDVNFYPIAEARTSNMRHRPIGIGVQVCCVVCT